MFGKRYRLVVTISISRRFPILFLHILRSIQRWWKCPAGFLWSQGSFVSDDILSLFRKFEVEWKQLNEEIVKDDVSGHYNVSDTYQLLWQRDTGWIQDTNGADPQLGRAYENVEAVAD